MLGDLQSHEAAPRQSRRFRHVLAVSALPRTADMMLRGGDFCCAPFASFCVASIYGIRGGAAVDRRRQLNDVNPTIYITEKLQTILDGHLQTRIEELMPCRFQTVPSLAT